MIFALLAFAVLPQQSALRYDAGQVVIEADAPIIKRLLHLDADGVPDAIGLQRDTGVGTTIPHRTYVGGYYGDGAGGFDRLWTATIEGPFPRADDPVARGDFDGDGDDDFAVLVFGSLRVFLCDGRNEAVAQPPVSFASTFATGLEAADLNGDGRDDLVGTSDFGGGLLSVVLSPTDWSTATVAFQSVGAVADGLALLELNGSVHAVVSRPAPSPSPTFDVLLYDLAGGVIQLAAQFSVPDTGGDELVLAAGDIDGDGDDDVVGFEADEYYVLRSQAGTLTLESARVGGPATHLFDIDQDGDLDGVCCGGGGNAPPELATWTSHWEISLNDGAGNFDVAYSIIGVGGRGWAGAGDFDGDGDLDLAAGRTVVFDLGTNYQAPSAGLALRLDSGALSDAEGDGDVDLSVGLQSAGLQGGGAPTYLRNAGGLVFESHAFTVTGGPPVALETHTIASGDFDGDGDIDLVQTLELPGGATETYLARNVGGDRLERGTASSFTIPALTPGRKALVFDWNRDGHTDIVTTRSSMQWPMGVAPTNFFIGDGNGNFSDGGVHSDTWILERADLDGDGVEDFVLALAQGLGTRKGLSTGGYGPFTALPLVCRPRRHVAVGDFDGDGDLDIIGMQEGSQTPVVFENDGNGAWVRRTSVLPRLVSGPVAFEFWTADFDADGRSDLIVHPSSTGASVAELYRSTGAGTLAFELDQLQTLSGVHAADLDLDGDEDLAGAQIHRNLAIDAETGGSYAQYGSPTSGSDGIVPKLGVSNAIRAGRFVRIQARGARGGQLSYLAFGFSAAELANFPVVGVTAYIDPGTVTTIPFLMPGAPLPGEGRLDLPFFVPPGIAGVTVFHQLFVLDPGAVGGMAASQALSVTYGAL